MNNFDPSNKSAQNSEEGQAHLEDAPKKMRLSRKVIIAFLIFDVLVLIPIILFFILIPTGEIKDLNKGHVQVNVTQDKEGEYKVDYKMVQKKPKNWVDIKDMNYTAIHAIVISEDWAFYDHSGYDVKQIKEAAQEVVAGDRTRGASTISQQLVKNLFLSPEKELSRKVKELGISVYLERNISKEKILETYLNVIEFGPGIYGIKAASKHYFDKSPNDLNAREGAFLAMLLPNPKRHSQSFRDKELTPFAEKRIKDILEKMSVAKYLRKDQVEKEESKKFLWEDKRKDQSNEMKNSNSKRKNNGSSKRKAKKKVDNSLKLEENPEFDEDAIIEDMSGFESEFSVE